MRRVHKSKFFPVLKGEIELLVIPKYSTYYCSRSNARLSGHAMQGNHTLVTGGYDGLVLVWNTDSGALSAHLSPPGLTHIGLQERSVEQVPPTAL